MPEIFVSYRRDDSCWSAGRINDLLVAAFGSDKVFFDTINIEPGADFHEVIGRSVEECRVLLAVIGPAWVRSLEQRTGSDGDFVSIEIAEALRRGVRVIPILIDGAQAPTEGMLPEPLKPLARRHAVSITSERCRQEIERLVAFLKGYLAEALSDKSGARAARATPPVRCIGDDGPLSFKDAPIAPEMVVVAPGSFVMGITGGANPGDEEGRPAHEVDIAQPFAVGRHAVTVAEFDAFLDATDHPMAERMFTCEDGLWREREGRSTRSPGFAQSPRHPAVGIGWDDAVAYCRWLSGLTDKTYRLLSEAEWEYCCCAGSPAAYCWGPKLSPAMANYDTGAMADDAPPGPPRMGTVPVDCYAPNAWGLFQMHGNVWEWCGDVWHDSYAGAPDDGRAWDAGDPALRVLRGGSWMSVPSLLRSRTRNREAPGVRMSTIGFRVARCL